MSSWIDTETKRNYHPVSNLFPLMTGGEFEALKDSIVRNGLLEPIVLLDDGAILDGRNRHRACIETEIRPAFKQYKGDCSPIALWEYVKAKNKDRRHLTSSQWAVIAIEHGAVIEQLEQEARARKLATLRQGERLPVVEQIPQREQGRTREKVARLFNTNPRYVQEAKRLRDKAPDLLDEVRAGKKSIPQAKRELKRRHREPQPTTKALPAQKAPRLIVASASDMSPIKTGSVDLIITSPPYNLGEEYWPMGGAGRIPRDGIGYSDTMSEEQYQEWQIACLNECYRVARNGASFFYNHKVRNRRGAIIHPLEWLKRPDNPWIIRQEIIWDRGSTHNHSESLFWPHDERIYWMTKNKPTLPNRPIGLPTIWRFHGPVADTWHPAPFAEELPKHCIEAIGRDSIVVLDPFAGSCTTLKVALSYGYDAIGVDIEREYLDRAAEENGWKKTSAS